jgi:hypothetical protein
LKNSKNLFVFPTPFESGGLRQLLGPERRKGISIAHCGVGWAQARLFLAKIPREKPIILCGFAAGTADNQQIGEVITVKTEITRIAPPQVSGSGMSAWPSVFFQDEAGRIFASCTKILGLEDKRQLASRAPGCQFAEMEFLAFWEWCQQCKNEAGALQMIRILSDTRDDDLPLPSDYWLHPRTGQPCMMRLLQGLLRHPQRWPRFGSFVGSALRLRRQLGQHLLRNYI